MCREAVSDTGSLRDFDAVEQIGSLPVLVTITSHRLARRSRCGRYMWLAHPTRCRPLTWLALAILSPSFHLAPLGPDESICAFGSLQGLVALWVCGSLPIYVAVPFRLARSRRMVPSRNQARSFCVDVGGHGSLARHGALLSVWLARCIAPSSFMARSLRVVAVVANGSLDPLRCSPRYWLARLLRTPSLGLGSLILHGALGTLGSLT